MDSTQLREDSPVNEYLTRILTDAAQKQASDIHMEPYEKRFRIRFRCDGLLVEYGEIEPVLAQRLTARIKILANLDIAEKRLPQDGRFRLTASSQNPSNENTNGQTKSDLRVSTLPTIWGEKIVLRILHNTRVDLDIDSLGFSEAQKEVFLNAIHKPHGLILITGPTGCGKTNTLYSGLNLLNTTEKNIATAEDPVEINLPGINQVQIDAKLGFGFAQALRTFLRQDPDIVMVGEIRDAETADIAVKAAQTGHLVLSTLHTNSSREAVTRLLNLGIDKHALASALSLVVAQRLVRRLCPLCKQPVDKAHTSLPLPKLGDKPRLFHPRPEGCPACIRGYLGRIGIFELLRIDEQTRNLIESTTETSRMKSSNEADSTGSLEDSGLEKVAMGVTSLTELKRVLL